MASNRREFFLEADKRGPVRRFWDDQIMWRANALYHNDALNLPVKMLTGSRMDDPVTLGRTAEAALPLIPLGVLGRVRTAKRTVDAAKAARMTVEEAQAVGRTLSPNAQSYYFRELGKTMPMESTVAYPLAKNSAVRRAIGGIRQAYKAAGAIGGAVRSVYELGKGAMKLNQAAGRAWLRPALKAAVGVERGTSGLAKIGWGVSDFAASPLGMYWEYRYFKNPEDQREKDDQAVAENEAAWVRLQETQDAAETAAARSDTRVLRSLLARRLKAYDEANLARVPTASVRVHRAREKGQALSEEELDRRIQEELAVVDSENRSNLMKGLDRNDPAWQKLFKERMTELMADSEGEFQGRYGYSYKDGLELAKANKKVAEQMKGFEEELRSRVPAGEMEQLRWLTGGGYGR